MTHGKCCTHPAFPWVLGGTLSRPTVLGPEVVGIGLKGTRGAIRSLGYP